MCAHLLLCAEDATTASLPFVQFALFLFIQLYVPVVASSPVRSLSNTLYVGLDAPTHDA